MNQIGQSTKKISIFQNEHDDNDNNDDDDNDDDTHPPLIIVHVGMIFRRGQKEVLLILTLGLDFNSEAWILISGARIWISVTMIYGNMMLILKTELWLYRQNLGQFTWI